ncbi:hypothetical protein FUT12_08460 [Bacillus mycoides]|jgi:hypothetical protein|uniref:hypothetical protein n=1 Tax=Bacillus mycoides TaxID=1405 RepID=UPI00187AF86B|nr:hypothetical protein [Bacillus mycoides]MBE7147616.1 hypothetical protein [Bacillus mycoides]
MMDAKTKCFIQNLNEKLQFCTYEFIKLEDCGEKEQVGKELQTILSDIEIMIHLTELFMLIDSSYASELKQIHEKLLQKQEYIQFECTNDFVRV